MMDGCRKITAPLASMEEEDAILNQAPPTSVAVLSLSPSSPLETTYSNSRSAQHNVHDSESDSQQAEQSPVWKEFHETAAVEIKGEKYDWNKALAPTLESEASMCQKDEKLAQNIARSPEPEQNLPTLEDEHVLFKLDFSDPASLDYAARNRHPHLVHTVSNDNGQRKERQTVSQDTKHKNPPGKYPHTEDDKFELVEIFMNEDGVISSDSDDVQQMRTEISADPVKSARKIRNSIDRSLTMAQDDDSSEVEETVFHRTIHSPSEEAHGQTQRRANRRGSRNSDEDERDDLRAAFQLLLPTRRKSSPFSRARLKAFLLKYVLFLLNFCFWTASVGAMALGAWVLEERGRLVRDSASFFLDPSGMLCLLGALTFLVAFCGCLGALRENIVLLKLFQLSMVVVLCVEALIVVLVFAFYQMPQFRKHLKGGPEEVLTVAIRRYHDDDELRRWIDWIQTEFQCCGARHSETGYKDWQENPYFNCTPHNPSVQRCGVPRSCCIIERGEYINHMCGFDTTNKQRGELFGRIRTQGCMRGLGLWLSAHDVTIGAVSLSIVLPEILCVVLAHQLVQHIRRQRVRWTELHSRHT